MAEAFLVDAVRTPVGRRGGGLAGVHPADLGAHVITALLDRTGVDPLAVDDVVFGCVDTIGPQAGDIARTAWLAAGLPEEVPGVTVDRQCGSSQQAVHFAAQAVPQRHRRPGGGGRGAEHEPDPDLGRDARRAGLRVQRPVPRLARMAGPVRGPGNLPVPRGRHDRRQVGDQPRRDGSVRAVQPRACHPGGGSGRVRGRDRPLTARCPPTSARAGTHRRRRWPPWRRCATDGLVTAALSSQIADAAAAVLIASARAVRVHGLRPLARICHLSARGDDPVMMLTAPIAATAHALDRAGLTMDQIDLAEVNEAFAPVVLAWLRETGADPARVNASGGAIALGHPLGATGARLMTTLLHSLVRTGGRYGLVTMCEGGGQANVTIIERL